MLMEQQESAREEATVKLQQKSSPSETGLVSDSEKRSARINASERRAVCTLLPVEGFEAHWAAAPPARATVMQAESQVRSS